MILEGAVVQGRVPGGVYRGYRWEGYQWLEEGEVEDLMGWGPRRWKARVRPVTGGGGGLESHIS